MVGKAGPFPWSRRTRWLALAALLVAQTVFFVVLLKRPLEVEGDNPRYEVAGYNIATGRGYSLPLVGEGATNDPEIYSWVCGRHPEACSPDTTHPTAVYMPGYSFFIAAVYSVFGRSLLALALAQLVLLWILFALFEQLAARLLPNRGYFFVMAVAATYPFLARQAAIVMSDHLHAVFWLAAMAALTLLRPGPARGASFGVLMALATLCRPYSLLVFPALWGVALLGRCVRLSKREWLAGAFAFLLPFTVWSARNAYYYGRFLPLTTGNAGANLYQASLEWDVDLSDPATGAAWYLETTAKYGDVQSRRGGQLQSDEALRRIRAHPWKYAERVLVHVPKLWVTTSTRLWVASVAYLGGLLALGVAGAWAARRDARFYPLIIAIAVNWVFLLPFPGEARRTLPLRLPMLLLAGVAAGPFIDRLLDRRSRLVAATR